MISYQELCDSIGELTLIPLDYYPTDEYDSEGDRIYIKELPIQSKRAELFKGILKGLNKQSDGAREVFLDKCREVEKTSTELAAFLMSLQFLINNRVTVDESNISNNTKTV